MKSSTRIWAWTSGGITVAALIGASVWFFHSNLTADRGALSSPSSSASTSPASSAEESSSGRSETPSADDSIPADNDPGDGVARDEPAATPSTPAADGRIAVDVVLTRWGTSLPFTVGGYVQGVVENTGTCTATLTRDDVQITATGVGNASANGTDCGEGLSFADARLTGSGWQLVLSYSSDSYVGSSNAQEVSFS